MKPSVRLKFQQIVILLIIICIIGVIGACKNKNNEGEIAPPSVIVVPAFEQSVIESMNIVGQVVAKESVYLRARVRGFLEKRNFNQGSFVRTKELLFQLEKTEYEAQVEAAKAQLDTAKANLKNDTIDYERQKYLANKNAVAKRILDKAAAQKAISEASILSAKAVLKEAKLDLSYTNISSPFNGRIGLAKYSVGNVVGPNSEPLAYIVMIDPIEVEFNLTESFITTIHQEEYSGKKHPDQKSKKKPSVKEIAVKLTLSNGTKYAEDGIINFFDNVINSMTGTIKMRAVFKNKKAILLPGAYVTVGLQRRDKVTRLLIPQAAIQEDQAGRFVMQVDKNNIVTKQEIKTGTIYGINIVVKSGLKTGDLIVTEGLQKIRTGIKVDPKKEKETQQGTKNDSADKEAKKKPAEPSKDNETTGKKAELATEKNKKTEENLANKPIEKTENKEKQPKQN